MEAIIFLFIAAYFVLQWLVFYKLVNYFASNKERSVLFWLFWYIFAFIGGLIPLIFVVFAHVNTNKKYNPFKLTLTKQND